MQTESHTGLTLLLGPANSGKLGRVLQWWGARLAERPVLVTPTTPDARELTAEMVRRAGALIDQSAAVTFDGLVRLLLARSPRYATDLERDFILSRLLRDTPLAALQGASRLPGSVKALANLLQQLGESGREPEEVDGILARWASADPQIAALAGDIRQLAGGYAGRRERLGLDDRPAAVREAAARLAIACVPAGADDGRVAAGPAPAAGAGGRDDARTPWGRPVALYGFTSFTPGQRALIEMLSRRTQVLVTFTHDPSRNVNLTTPSEIAWWRSRATRVDDVSADGGGSPNGEVALLERGRRPADSRGPGSVAPQSPPAYESPAIAYLERYFMSDGPRPVPPPAYHDNQGVRFLLASGKRAEAELAAEQIAGLLRAGCPPQDIAVVVRHVPAWSVLLARIFRSCNIPVGIDDRPLIAQTGLGHAFMNAVRGVCLDDAGSLLAYLHTPYSGISPETVSDLELRYRRGAAKGVAALASFARWMRVWEIESLGEMVAPGGLVRLPAAARMAQAMLMAGTQNATAGSDDLEEDARAFAALRVALRSLAALSAEDDTPGGDVTPSLVDCRVLLTALGSVSVSSPVAGYRDAVQVLSVQRARARRFPVVLVLGLVEGEFPGRPDRPSLLSPSQKARLDATGNGLFAPEADQEAALFVSAVSRASRLLFLSARDAEDDGSEATRSYFWQLAKSLLSATENETACRTLGEHVFSLPTAPTRRHFERSCALSGAEPAAGAVPGARPEAVRPWNRVPQTLSHPAVLAELSNLERFSPSALESYARCPFAWFVQTVVGAEELDCELDGKYVGKLIHSVLTETYQRLGSLDLLPLRTGGIEAARRIADGCIERSVNSDQCPGTTAERRVAGWRLRRMAYNLFDMEAAAQWPLVPAEMEMWVGSKTGVDVGGFRVHGRVDRVDVAGDGRGVFVLDYKSGAIPSSSAIGREEALQLPLYLMALAADWPEARVAGGAYVALADGKRSGVVMPGAEELVGAAGESCKVLDEAGAESLFESTRALSRQAIEGMKSGVIVPRSDRACPPWCLLGPACRARRGGYRP